MGLPRTNEIQNMTTIIEMYDLDGVLQCRGSVAEFREANAGDNDTLDALGKLERGWLDTVQVGLFRLSIIRPYESPNPVRSVSDCTLERRGISITDSDWSEYDAAALWCAKRGLRGTDGDRLPVNTCAETVAEINADPEAFERRVRESAYALAREGVTT